MKPERILILFQGLRPTVQSSLMWNVGMLKFEISAFLMWNVVMLKVEVSAVLLLFFISGIVKNICWIYYSLPLR